MNIDKYDQIFLNELGKRIREVREKKGLSQEKLSFVCRLHRTYIGAIERGERNISIVNLRKISHALDLSISDLFSTLKERQQDEYK